MQLEITHPAFKTQRLAVQTAGWVAGPNLLVNGSPATKRKGRYTVVSDSGANIEVKLKYNYFDPVPKVQIGEEVHEVLPPLRWYEYAWIGIPIVLLAGGAIGGFVGALGVLANGRIFRGDYGSGAKFAFSALVTVGAFVAYVVLAALFRLLFKGP